MSRPVMERVKLFTRRSLNLEDLKYFGDPFYKLPCVNLSSVPQKTDQSVVNPSKLGPSKAAQEPTHLLTPELTPEKATSSKNVWSAIPKQKDNSVIETQSNDEVLLVDTKIVSSEKEATQQQESTQPKCVQIINALLDIENNHDFALYEGPADALEIHVQNPATRVQGRSKYTEYEVTCATNLPAFRYSKSTVRRRYSDFEWFRGTLVQECPRVAVPELPGKVYANRFAPEVIEERRRGLERFLQQMASHPLVQRQSSRLIPFLQDPGFICQDFAY